MVCFRGLEGLEDAPELASVPSRMWMLQEAAGSFLVSWDGPCAASGSSASASVSGFSAGAGAQSA